MKPKTLVRRTPPNAVRRGGSSAKPRSAVLALFVLLGCWISATASAAPRKPAQPPPPPGNRFLVVVETSRAMLPFEHAGRQAVFDLLFSGIEQQAQPGDTIGLWNFGEKVYAGLFPMQVWQPEQNLQTASLAGLFLKNQKYEDHGRLDVVIPKLLGLIKAVQDVNILIVCSTEQVWKGTPLDAELNLAIQKRASDSLIAKRPLITALAARNGVLVSWSVTLPEEPIPLPPAPAAARIAQAASPQVSTNAPSSLAAGTGEKVVLAAPPVKRIFITSKKPGADEEVEPGDIRVMVKPKEPEPPKAAEQPAPIARAEPKPESMTTRQESASSNNISSVPAPAEGVPGGLLSQVLNPVTVSARENPGANAAAPALALAHPPQPFLTARNLFLLGAAFMIIALGLLFMAFRFLRAAPKPSFITRSFEREKP